MSDGERARPKLADPAAFKPSAPQPTPPHPKVDPNFRFKSAKSQNKPQALTLPPP